MLLKRKPRGAMRPCPHCGQGMDARAVKCGACGRLIRLETAIVTRPSIDILLAPTRDDTRHEW